MHERKTTVDVAVRTYEYDLTLWFDGSVVMAVATANAVAGEYRAGAGATGPAPGSRTAEAADTGRATAGVDGNGKPYGAAIRQAHLKGTPGLAWRVRAVGRLPESDPHDRLAIWRQRPIQG